MTELCKELKLTIFKEDDPDDKSQERVRVRLYDEMNMQEVELCEQINQTTHQSRRYHVMEAVVIVLRKVVSEAFREGLISDALGEWKITRPKGSSAKPEALEIDLNDSML